MLKLGDGDEKPAIQDVSDSEDNFGLGQHNFCHEESKIISRTNIQSTNKLHNNSLKSSLTPVNASKSPGSSRTQPYVIIEGPEPSQDLSYKWVAKYENVGEIEKGVPLHEF